MAWEDILKDDFDKFLMETHNKVKALQLQYRKVHVDSVELLRDIDKNKPKNLTAEQHRNLSEMMDMWVEKLPMLGTDI